MENPNFCKVGGSVGRVKGDESVTEGWWKGERG